MGGAFLLFASHAAVAAVEPGIYDGGQMELAAALELRPDGRFRYGLSYGALDERAEGRWSERDAKVILTSDTHDPADLSFSGEPLDIEGSDLILRRHERVIRFRKTP